MVRSLPVPCNLKGKIGALNSILLCYFCYHQSTVHETMPIFSRQPRALHKRAPQHTRSDSNFVSNDPAASSGEIKKNGCLLIWKLDLAACQRINVCCCLKHREDYLSAAAMTSCPVHTNELIATFLDYILTRAMGGDGVSWN
jgi:hypothetical protein